MTRSVLRRNNRACERTIRQLKSAFRLQELIQRDDDAFRLLIDKHSVTIAVWNERDSSGCSIDTRR